MLKLSEVEWTPDTNGDMAGRRHCPTRGCLPEAIACRLAMETLSCPLNVLLGLNLSLTLQDGLLRFFPAQRTSSVRVSMTDCQLTILGDIRRFSRVQNRPTGVF